MAKRIAVIGAGLSGLTAIKQLKDEEHEVTCFEASSDMGGVFGAAGACYSGLRLTVSNYFMAYSDFTPAEQRYRFWNQREYRKYLGDYAERFDLERHVLLEHRVTNVIKSGREWRVTTQSEAGEKTSTFDAVAVCSGMFVHKKIPEIEGLADFPGRVMHSQDFKTPADFEGKRVLCIGLGESSSDITSEISEVASECHLSLRRYPAVAPRYVPFQRDEFFTIDSSWNTVRNFNNVPKTFHKRLTGGIFKEYARSRNLDTRLRGHWLSQSGPTGDQVINKNERIFENLADGKVKPNMSGISRFESDRVIFKDGQSEQLDAVVLCTGYHISFPFLRDQPQMNLRSLYLQMFDPDQDESLAFIGFARPQQGGIPAIAEMQSRYFAQVCSGLAELPSASAQRACAAQHEQHWRREFPITPDAVGLVNYVHYMDMLAEKVGCLPKKPSYVFEPGLRIKLDFNPIFCAQYRLNGPHANREEAVAFLKSFPNVFSRAWIIYLMFAQMWLWLVRNRHRTKLLKTDKLLAGLPSEGSRSKSPVVSSPQASVEGASC